MFTSVLIANRGEIACRIIETLKRLRVTSIAIYTPADSDARHVTLADRAFLVDSYLSVDAVIAAAQAAGAAAVHPGYGFLSENESFATRCAEANIAFVGPSSEAIRVMGDKITAKQAVSARGVPTVPGAGDAGMTNEQLAELALGVGFPLLIKPSAGGGGKGMHVVSSATELAAALSGARREAASSFGDDTLFVERYLTSPRHIEVQVLADTFGNIIHLGERDCTLQRRHQKVIEEAPSAIITPELRERLGKAACETALSVSYTGVGTVEFIVSNHAPEEFFFMEMNTRLQVEHPVTEQITGLDLVEWQLRVASGEPLTLSQSDIVLTGHAIEARIYAEDPMSDFLPTGGRVEVLTQPKSAGVRIDSALIPGLVVSSDYDPMLAKIIAWAPEREDAIALLRTSLATTTVLGVATNIEFLHLLLGLPEVSSATMDTELIGRELEHLAFAKPTDVVFATAALLLFAHEWAAADGSVWSAPSGWRLNGSAASAYRLAIDGRGADDGFVRTVAVSGEPDSALVVVEGGAPHTGRVNFHGTHSAFVSLGNEGRTVEYVVSATSVEFALDEVSWRLREVDVPRRRADADDIAPTVASPMPGSVVAVLAERGTMVEAGQPLLVVEAMKMEHVLSAPSAGILRLDASVGDHVARGQVLATIERNEQ